MSKPDVYELILRRCEAWCENADERAASAIIEDSLMPIIRELCELVKIQQTELKRIADYFCACSADDEIIPQVVAHNTLAATSERLNKLGKAE
jgi:hypothetical protein